MEKAATALPVAAFSMHSVNYFAIELMAGKPVSYIIRNEDIF